MEMDRQQPTEPGCWDSWAAEYLGISLSDYYFHYLWWPAGLVTFDIDQEALKAAVEARGPEEV